MTACLSRPDGDHLRVCGADAPTIIETGRGLGSPPRVRSRPAHRPRNRWRPGITSACAEQTRPARLLSSSIRDHLRVCGADMIPDATADTAAGSPPRVRSRHGSAGRRDAHGGITSACAEQTRSPGNPSGRTRDHLRVCGADDRNGRRRFGHVGSPPRVRSRRAFLGVGCVGVGITSACAEQTGETHG